MNQNEIDALVSAGFEETEVDRFAKINAYGRLGAIVKSGNSFTAYMRVDGKIYNFTGSLKKCIEFVNDEDAW